MVSKHTPGPWNIAYSMNQMTGTWTYRIGPIQFDQHACGKSFDELHHNAKLIAAAPMMLEALQLCRKHMYNYSSNTSDNAFEKLCAAIEEATGENT